MYIDFNCNFVLIILHNANTTNLIKYSHLHIVIILYHNDENWNLVLTGGFKIFLNSILECARESLSLTQKSITNGKIYIYTFNSCYICRIKNPKQKALLSDRNIVVVSCKNPLIRLPSLMLCNDPFSIKKYCRLF